jgi:hypothetical protein
MLHRIDPKHGIRRFYGPMIDQDLFGTRRLDWDGGGQGQEVVEIHEDEFAAGQALEALTQLKRR